ncbi:hypothetical protein ABT317_10080 [Streptomyces carpinensis]|uniref:Uncharacterized protein n=1 Tax=Streptomyces carpinensis TaxID=66369 RepID=A0ABV1VZJ0_9ACTN
MTEGNETHRIVRHLREDGSHVIAVLRRGGEGDQLSDEEIVARLDAWKAGQRHLHAVDDV